MDTTTSTPAPSTATPSEAALTVLRQQWQDASARKQRAEERLREALREMQAASWDLLRVECRAPTDTDEQARLRLARTAAQNTAQCSGGAYNASNVVQAITRDAALELLNDPFAFHAARSAARKAAAQG